MAILEIRWANAHQHGDAWYQHHLLRQKVFIDRMGWDIPSANGAEYDQYDTPASWYILWKNELGVVQGSVRLVPTTMPYMALDLWPEMLGNHRPRDASIWEATRFCCDHDLTARERSRVVSGLIEGCQRFGLKRGIDHFIGVMPLMIFKRSLKASGCEYELLGEVKKIGRFETGAAKLKVSAKILKRVRVIALSNEIRYLEKMRAEESIAEMA